MSKWQKIQPDQIRVGDRVRVKTINQPDAYDFTVFERGATWIGVFATVNHREWYIRKPKKAKPPTRPDEPPVGSFFRVDRTASCYVRFSVSRSHYYCIDSIEGEPSWRSWDKITEPGDTIQRLWLTSEPTE